VYLAFSAARVGFARREVARLETTILCGSLGHAAVLGRQDAQSPVQNEIVESDQSENKRRDRSNDDEHPSSPRHVSRQYGWHRSGWRRTVDIPGRTSLD